MAGLVGTPQLTGGLVPGTTNTYSLNVIYQVKFDPFEIANFKFREGFVLWEEDDTSSDDMLTGVVSVKEFAPKDLLLSQDLIATRTLTFTISGDVLDTELGGEELYAMVRLRNLNLNILFEKRSTTLPLAP